MEYRYTIGGEHLFDRKILGKSEPSFYDSWELQCRKDYYVQYTFGGYFSLMVILENFKSFAKSDFDILVPSYLCPSMLKPFKALNVNFRFYRISESLYVDEDHLKEQISNQTAAVLFIDYFGSSQASKLSRLFKELQNRNIKIIQDIVQTVDIPSSSFYGDYVFNSFRKFLPVEGSILLSKQEMNIEFGHSEAVIQTKRWGQLLRKVSLKTGIDLSFVFLPALKKFETNYYQKEILALPESNRKYLSRLDFKEMIWKQRYFFNRLKKKYGHFQPDLLQHQSSNLIPLGFILTVKNRDQFRNYLFGKRIFAPIHWVLTEDINKEAFPESWKLSEEIITIPLVNMTEQKFNYLTKSLDQYFVQ